MSEQMSGKQQAIWRSKDPDIKFFGEYAIWDDFNITEKEAKEYLELWKKIILRKFSSDLYEVELLDEFWTENPRGALAQSFNKTLKLAVKAKWKFELPK